MHTRRNFIRTTGISAAGLGLLPAFSRIGNIVNFHPGQTDGYKSFLLPRMSPESQGISSAAVLDFIKATRASGLDWHSFMLLRHGNVIAEGWWKPFEPQFKHTLYSLSKSFTSTAIGLLVQEGKISVDDPVISFFKDELPEPVSDNLARMKIKHLLTMNTGHNEDTMGKLRNATETWTKTFFAQPVVHEPGTHFLYNTGATYMLGAILYKVTGQKLETYLSPRLFEPLEIKDYDWEYSPQGLNTAGYGLRVKTEDIARFGQLYLQKGKWNGKQVVSESWINEATRYQTSSQEGNGDWAQGYGYQFWRCKPGGYRGDGAYGQFCIVMPEQDAVLAITSESWDMQKSMTTAWETLLPAMQASELQESPATWNALKKELKTLSLPTPKGQATPTSAARYNDKNFRMDTNAYGVTGMQFNFSGSNCQWTIKTPKGPTMIRLGWENWRLNPDSAPYTFILPGRTNVPSKVAGTATWIGKNTLQLNLRFVESIHGDTVTCTFDENKLTVTFLNSIAENTKNGSEERKGLTGQLTASSQ